MSEQQSDFLNGLHVVAYELQRVIGELDEMQDRRDIPTLDRVSLDPLQWALNKLADDLHDANVEIRNARLHEASAKREADEARRQRDAANEQHAIWVRKYDAEVERRQALEKQLAELTEKAGELPPEPAPESYDWQVGDEIEDDGGVRRPVTDRDAKGWVSIKGNGALPQFEWERRRWKLHRKASDIQPQAPEPYQWQVGDEIECPGVTRRKVVGTCRPWVSLEGIQEACPQPEWERRRWKLYRKASELPDIPPFTEQQVAEFAAVTELCDDSVSAAAADEGRP